MTGQTEISHRGLVALKVAHTLLWAAVEVSMAYLLYAGLKRRSGRSVAVAGAVVAGESVIFLANGARCPLTRMAESMGAERGSVTDIFLPRWFARNLPAIHVPLVVLATLLHWRSVRARPLPEPITRS